MLVDHVGPNDTISADICIVGGGPAGLTVAEELARAGLSVVLLETGDFTFDPTTQKLAEGRASGPLLSGYDSYLRDSRYFHLGGAGGWWGGFCVPFTAIDFEHRPWVAKSGWPISRAQLAPYYERAARWLGFHPIEDERTEDQRLRKALAPAQSGALTTQVYHFPPSNRFSETALRAWVAATPARVLLNSVATRLVAHGGRLERVEAVSLAGTRFVVQAATFVLAAGGIENARILLEAGAEQSLPIKGAGLGENFMEHFHVVLGTVQLPRSAAWSLYTKVERDAGLGHSTLGVLSLAATVQREYRLLNYSVQLKEQPSASEGNQDGGGTITATLFGRAEQAPSPESRLTLARERDSLGRRRVALDWRVTEQDWTSVVSSTCLVGEELVRCFGARPSFTIDEARPWPGEPRGPSPNLPHTWGAHHMGTTRMDPDPSRGVVDADCRVHGLSNLFVAGSSVFPTGSFANPTFTLLALAIRLADHVRERMGRTHHREAA
jgi:choline dehydrogenase-like flavoprotein